MGLKSGETTQKQDVRKLRQSLLSLLSECSGKQSRQGSVELKKKETQRQWLVSSSSVSSHLQKGLLPRKPRNLCTSDLCLSPTCFQWKESKAGRTRVTLIFSGGKGIELSVEKSGAGGSALFQ